MLDDYVKIAAKGHKALVRGDCQDSVAAALIDGAGCVPAGDSGRGTVQRFPCGERWGILRKYLRGGMIRHIVRESYLLHNRPLRELRLHDHVWRQGLPVPEPLGAAWQWRGPFVRGAFATVEIPAPTLLEYVQTQPAQGVEAMRGCGELFRRMHDLGVWHADLQVRNVLVGETGFYLIDLDNARLIPGMSRVQRARNLFRFRRSLEKNRLPLGLFEPLCRAYGEEKLPSWIGRIYHAKGAVSDAMRGPAMALEVYGGHTVTQIGRLRLYHRAELDPQTLLKAVHAGGEILKRSSKTETRRVGEWAVKLSRIEGGLGPLKRTLARGRYRRAWVAANYLHGRGVRVPQPMAYGEWTSFGIVLGNVLVTRFLAGHVNVEVYAAQLVRNSATQEAMGAFFAGLASAVNRLTSAGAYHADLSGKNIFTKDGSEFYFIDLDGVVLGRAYCDALRLKNHIQLYDSFCDFCDHDTLARFHARMLTDTDNLEGWMRLVVEGQRARRRRHHGRQRG